MMPTVEQMMKRQRVLADFGEFALQSENLDDVLTEACRLVGQALGTGRAKILEIQEGRRELLLRAGVGWAPHIVGHVRLQMSERSSETFSIREGQPIISQDIHQEDRFEIPAFMKEAGVIAMVNVPIFAPGQKPYGLLQVDACEPRDFGQDEIEFLRTYATILGPVIDRLHKIGSLQASEERFRHIVETARDYAIYTTDPQNRIDGWFAGAEAVYGWSATEAIGQPASITFAPEDRQTGQPEKELEVAQREGLSQNARWRIRQDGRRIFVDGAVRTLQDAAGRVQGFVNIGRDLTERRESDDRLRESEARHRILVESWTQAVWETDAEGVVHVDSPSWRAYTGQDLHEWLGYGWLDAIHPDDRGYAERQWREAVAARRPVNAEFRLRAPDGGWRWTNVRAAPVLDADGHIQKWAGVNINVHDMRELQNRQQVLMAELQHRTSNLMSVVQGTLDSTLRASTSLDEFSAKFRDRFAALARVQRLLSRLKDRERVTFDVLIRDQMQAVGALDRVSLRGPPKVALRSSTVQTFAMALHELTTNAVKYGALAQASGRLVITWRVDTDQPGGRRWLHVDWHESGVTMPPTGAAPTGSGQGRQLIERALPYQLGANTTYVMGPDGVRCSIAVPVSHRMAVMEPNDGIAYPA